MLSAIISSALQLGAVLLVCLFFYGFSARCGFARFIGLRRAPIPIVILGGLIGLVSASLLIAIPRVRALAGGSGSVVAAQTAHGVTTQVVVALIVMAIFKTALAEEILFRGLIARRLINWLGFAAGNALQAVLFGAVHLLLVLVGKPDIVALSALVGFATVMGWLGGWMKERLASGSILPSVAAHACANLVTYLSLPLVYGIHG
jgi:membrane protease YdiL (CAAX protease family)